MATRPTFNELFEAARDFMQTLAPELRDFETGSNLWAIAQGGAALGEQTIAVVLDAFKAAYVETAEEEALGRRIVDFGGPVRLTETPAVAPITITRTTAVGDVTIPSGTSFRGTAPNGATVVFETAEDFTLAAVASEVDIEAICTAAGRAGNVPDGTLTTATGLPAGVSFAQPERAAGGTEDETDEAYRARYKLSLEVQARGTPAALEYGAKLVSGVTFAQVNEDNIAPEDGGYVAVYVGDPDAGSNSTLVDAVEVELVNWRAAGVEVLVFGTEREERDFTLTVKVRAGSGLTEADIKAAWIAYTDAHAVASTLYLSGGEAAVHDDLGPDCLSVDAEDDAAPGDREIAPSQDNYAIRTAADGSGITVVLTEV